MRIPFFKSAIDKRILSIAADYHTKCVSKTDINTTVECFFKNEFKFAEFILVKSCTHALEIAISALNLEKGAEVILPSFAYVALGNAVVMNGLNCVFVDCAEETMNISVESISAAITEKTKAIITINYAGVPCNYKDITSLCREHNLYLIEDNAHGFAGYKGNVPLGSFGDVSTFSFDYLKNISCEEGGGIAINNKDLIKNIYSAFFNGTDKQAFLKGEVEKYQWISKGSNYRLSPYLAAMLLPQLEIYKVHVAVLRKLWTNYYNSLKGLEDSGEIYLPKINGDVEVSGHIFWVRVKNSIERDNLISFFKRRDIELMFHYSPLHSSSYGMKIATSSLGFTNTIKSNTLLRLPIYKGLTFDKQNRIIELLYEYFQQHDEKE